MRVRLRLETARHFGDLSTFDECRDWCPPVLGIYSVGFTYTLSFRFS